MLSSRERRYVVRGREAAPFNEQIGQFLRRTGLAIAGGLVGLAVLLAACSSEDPTLGRSELPGAGAPQILQAASPHSAENS